MPKPAWPPAAAGPGSNLESAELTVPIALVEAIARRVAELVLEGSPGLARSELIDAAEVARRFGVDRAWVYAHADDLGVVRLGAGSRPRLRFEPRKVTAALACFSASRGSKALEAPSRRRGPTPATSPEFPLLPVRGYPGRAEGRPARRPSTASSHGTEEVGEG
jgi:hypothetical protein